MEPSWRKPFGVFLILLLITVWTVLIVSLSSWIGQLHTLIQAMIYLAAGVIWIMPLKPLLRWMER